MSELKHLLSPVTIRGKTFKNRITASPVAAGTVLRDGNSPTEATVVMGAKGAGGQAAASVGEVYVDHEYANKSPFPPATDFTVYSGPQFEGWKRYADCIKDGGALALIEISHCGDVRNVRGTPALGPVGFIREDGVEVIGMDEALMRKTAENHGVCAKFMKQAGFDGVVVHCGHGWLLHSFLSPRKNTRTDEYGGSAENRARFPLMVLKKVREYVGEDFLIEVRISGAERVEGGFDEKDMAVFCKMLEGIVDLIHVSGGTHDAALSGMYSNVYNEHFINIEQAAYIKANCGIPVNVVGGINSPELADKMIAEGKCDFIALGRQMFADSEFGNKCMNGEPEDINRCIRCFVCMEMGAGPGVPDIEAGAEAPPAMPPGPPDMWPEDFDFTPILPFMRATGPYCTVNAYRAVNLPESGIKKVADPKKILVVGGGPGGMQAAITAADFGHSVTLAEKAGSLGGLLKFTDTDVFKTDLRHHKDLLVKRVGDRDIRVLLNTEASRELIAAEKPDLIIAAVGSSPVKPPIPGIDECTHAIDAYYGAPAGKKVVMVGGGLIGCEAGLNFNEQGSDVTIIEMLDELAPDANNQTRLAIFDQIAKRGINAYTGMRCTKMSPDGVVAVDKDGAEHSFEADTVLYAMGMRGSDPAFISEMAGGIPVIPIGDCVRAGKVYKACHDAAETIVKFSAGV